MVRTMFKTGCALQFWFLFISREQDEEKGKSIQQHNITLLCPSVVWKKGDEKKKKKEQSQATAVYKQQQRAWAVRLSVPHTCLLLFFLFFFFSREWETESPRVLFLAMRLHCCWCDMHLQSLRNNLRDLKQIAAPKHEMQCVFFLCRFHSFKTWR